eukprot:TRINITY_DN8603_c0_g1_i1.p1 TRINITY_DN8603_c0_g1~~TRINITY_DN8603_c0_g1_i1.p1  ORF type:complete len:455 (+),score=180.84 TRINITY_DN8603_c0_g1_i1:57-1421(+)
MSRMVEATIIEPDHEEDYDSDTQDTSSKVIKDVNRLQSGGGLGERRLSKVEDQRLRTALGIIRSGSQRELKEECIRNEWYQVSDEQERDILKDCVTDEAFWEEVKELARKELEAEPAVMGEDQFRAMFREFDADNSGAIDAEELRKLLQQAMGMDCTYEEVVDLMSQVDTDGNGEIDEQEFLDIMNAAKKQQESSGYREQRERLEEASPLGQARKRRQSAFGEGPPRPPSRDRPLTETTIAIPPVPSSNLGVGATSSRHPLDSDDEDSTEKLSTKLRRKASYTQNKGEKVTLLGKATVEEYKEMLKSTAQAARRKSEVKEPVPAPEAARPAVRSDPAPSSPPVSSPATAGSPTFTPGAISISAAMKSSKRPEAGYSSGPVSPPKPKQEEVGIEVTAPQAHLPADDSTHSTEPCEEVVVNEGSGSVPAALKQTRSSPKKKVCLASPRPAPGALCR